MTVRIYSLTVAWNDQRFLRPVMDALVSSFDGVFVSLSDRPWNGSSEEPDETRSIIESYNNVETVHGSWRSETEQRNDLLQQIVSYVNDPFDGETYIAIVDADEIYDPHALKRIKNYISIYHCGKYSVCQNVYFKHGNWLVTPPDSHPPADVFYKLNDQFKFVMNRGCEPVRGGRHTIPRHVLSMHHMNLVGTAAEINSKHEHFSHPFDHISYMKNVWLPATIKSKNLHQLNPHLLPGLTRVKVPRFLEKYRDLLLLDEATS